MDHDEEIEIGKRINAALSNLRDAQFRMGMTGRWHLGIARKIAEANSVDNPRLQTFDNEDEETRYLVNLPGLISAIEVQDAKCAELWAISTLDSQTRYQIEHGDLCSLLLQLRFWLRSYERSVREPNKPLLEEAKTLVAEPCDAAYVKNVENHLRLRLRDYIELEEGIDATLEQLDSLRDELTEAHYEFAVQCAQEFNDFEQTTIDCALSAMRRAANTFDYSRGYRFMNYAKHWIYNAIQQQDKG